jgi:hypothetical protein
MTTKLILTDADGRIHHRQFRPENLIKIAKSVHKEFLSDQPYAQVHAWLFNQVAKGEKEIRISI